MSKRRADYDSPWKEALECYFEQFMALCFPEAHRQIDWTRGREFLDKELQQVAPDAAHGPMRVDKLAKVWLQSGDEAWVLIHVEVQGEAEAEFEERMYLYNARLYDRYRRRVASLAVLGDERPDWRPHRFGYDLCGCRVELTFPTAKLWDFRARWAELEQCDNPFALVLMAHLKAQETRRDDQERARWKRALIRDLVDRGYDEKEVFRVLRFVDWLVRLPDDLDRSVWQEVHDYMEVKKMPYVASFERFGFERGFNDGMQQGAVKAVRDAVLETLRLRFKRAPRALTTRIRALDDPAVLKELHRQAVVTESLEEFGRALASAVPEG